MNPINSRTNSQERNPIEVALEERLRQDEASDNDDFSDSDEDNGFRFKKKKKKANISIASVEQELLEEAIKRNRRLYISDRESLKERLVERMKKENRTPRCVISDCKILEVLQGKPL